MKIFSLNGDIISSKSLLEKHEDRTFQWRRAYDVLLIDSKAIPRNGNLIWVYVEPHNTVTNIGGNQYIFGKGTSLKVLPSEYTDKTLFLNKVLVLEGQEKVK